MPRSENLRIHCAMLGSSWMSIAKPVRRFSLSMTISRKRCGRAAAYHREQTSRHLRVTSPKSVCVTSVSSQKSSSIYSWSSNGSSNGSSEKFKLHITFIMKLDKIRTGSTETRSSAKCCLRPCFSMIRDSVIILRSVHRKRGVYRAVVVNTHTSLACFPVCAQRISAPCSL